MYVCMYSMYVRMHACMHAFMYVSTSLSLSLSFSLSFFLSLSLSGILDVTFVHSVQHISAVTCTYIHMHTYCRYMHIVCACNHSHTIVYAYMHCIHTACTRVHIQVNMHVYSSSIQWVTAIKKTEISAQPEFFSHKLS